MRFDYQLDWWRGHPANNPGSRKLYHHRRFLSQYLDEWTAKKAEQCFADEDYLVAVRRQITGTAGVSPAAPAGALSLMIYSVVAVFARRAHCGPDARGPSERDDLVPARSTPNFLAFDTVDGLPYYPATCRGVAQPGRALGSGPRGRRFESSRPDQTSHLSPLNNKAV